MESYSKQKWTAAITAVLVLVILGGVIIAYNRQKSNGELINLNNQTMDQNTNQPQANNTANVTGAMPNTTTQSSAGPADERKSGLIVQEISIGGGEEVKSGDTVAVNYTGMLTNGKVFDSSYNRNEAFTFTLGEGRVIRGWEEGVVGMKVGGKRKLTIPADLGYGSQGAGNVIPPNATLVFEIELVGIQK